ncbi:hypothetical protein H6P81_018108 [Aristolochia fimbriata]|uniref:Integrase zinc-binding domain-containing protein n=1 Tax=Aristolochia fimbriata TaxID=158543 RepID=A0AAV7E1Y3_ARIFI|nr:hypothetical protein H6P81_018108 [Aristolochia fimbriata]
MSPPILSGRLAKLALLLSEFEINIVPQRAIKGQVQVNFLADHPVPAKWELIEEFPDEEIFLVEVLPPWEMYFDGATRRNGAGAGWRSYEGLLLHYLSKEEGLQVLKETHSGICGTHQAGPKLHLQVKRLGYYWPTMLRDATEMARTCKPCQLHADYIHQPPEPIHPTIASWPFEDWMMDIIGPITPKFDSDRQYILAATGQPGSIESKSRHPATKTEVQPPDD